MGCVCTIVLQYNGIPWIVIELGEQIAILVGAGRILQNQSIKFQKYQIESLTNFFHFQMDSRLISNSLHIELHSHMLDAVALEHRMGDMSASSSRGLFAKALDRSAKCVLNSGILELQKKTLSFTTKQYENSPSLH